MYESKLAFRCPSGKHDTKISYSRRYTVKEPLQCSKCKHAAKECNKAFLKREEEEHFANLARLQAEELAKARKDFNEQLRNGLGP